jgi:photosystem II stability/assembly factor-like uncharacterized protein
MRIYVVRIGKAPLLFNDLDQGDGRSAASSRSWHGYVAGFAQVRSLGSISRGFLVNGSWEGTSMNQLWCSCVVGLICAFAPPAMAQQWLSQLPQTAREAPTIASLQQGFDSYYREHPVDLKLDKLQPTFRFQGTHEQNERVDIETYKMFRRWEWLVEPRAYPSGQLDLAQIATFREQVRGIDADLLARQSAQSPLRLIHVLPTWKPLGPSDAIGGTNMGRLTCINYDPKNPSILYLCAADGGIWKSTNGGAMWSPKFDREPTLSTGSIAIDPANTNVLYVATSDPFGYGVPFWGGTYSVGVMKSINGGNTWAATGLNWTVSQNRVIRHLAMDPSNPNILLAATSAGLYRTDNGGATWTQILPASTYDVEFQQNNGAIVYATTNQVMKSTNAGASFTALNATCPGARYNIQIAHSNPNVLYTLCTNATVQKSGNAGATWTATTAPGVTLYGYYDNVIAVSPVDDKVVYVAGFDMRRTTDGGNTWSTVPVAGHVDNHAITFGPGTSSTLLVGNDGGLFKSTNSGATWSSLNKGLAITQFYRVGISRTDPNIMVAGAQDNGNMKYTSGTWSNVTDADGMQDFVDWSNGNVIYAAIQYGAFYRSMNGGASFTGVSTPASGAWVTPWCQDPSSANTLYAGTDKVYKSVNQGTNWTAISGAPAGVGSFTVLKVAPSNTKVIYAGSGTKLYRTNNAGGTWTDITAGLPVATNYLTDIAISDTNPELAYATFSGYVAGQKVYRTTNGGAIWSNISGSLPNMPVDTIVYQKTANDAVYIGTDAGVYYRNDSMSQWVPYKTGLPNVIVDDLQIDYKTKTIRAATYGRGIWDAPLL